MDGDEPGRAWRADGFAVLPGYLPPDELAPALAELGPMFPSAGGFHDRADPRYRRYLGDEFAGIDAFPFASPELSLLAVHDRLAGLAETLLGDPDLRIYSAEAWAKFTGAADYDQALHRDYLNHTVLVPTTAPGGQQLAGDTQRMLYRVLKSWSARPPGSGVETRDHFRPSQRRAWLR